MTHALLMGSVYLVAWMLPNLPGVRRLSIDLVYWLGFLVGGVWASIAEVCMRAWGWL